MTDTIPVPANHPSLDRVCVQPTLTVRKAIHDSIQSIPPSVLSEIDFVPELCRTQYICGLKMSFCAWQPLYDDNLVMRGIINSTVKAAQNTVDHYLNKNCTI